VRNLIRRNAPPILALSLLASVLPASEVQAARPKCDGIIAEKIGTAGDDTILGTKGSDVIVTLGGNDVVRGRGGDDKICLGKGNDRSDGGGGKDRILAISDAITSLEATTATPSTAARIEIS
jgi:hypothetical protein